MEVNQGSHERGVRTPPTTTLSLRGEGGWNPHHPPPYLRASCASLGSTLHTHTLFWGEQMTTFTLQSLGLWHRSCRKNHQRGGFIPEVQKKAVLSSCKQPFLHTTEILCLSHTTFLVTTSHGFAKAQRLGHARFFLVGSPQQKDGLEIPCLVRASGHCGAKGLCLGGPLRGLVQGSGDRLGSPNPLPRLQVHPCPHPRTPHFRPQSPTPPFEEQNTSGRFSSWLKLLQDDG